MQNFDIDFLGDLFGKWEVYKSQKRHQENYEIKTNSLATIFSSKLFYLRTNFTHFQYQSKLLLDKYFQRCFFYRQNTFNFFFLQNYITKTLNFTKKFLYFNKNLNFTKIL